MFAASHEGQESIVEVEQGEPEDSGRADLTIFLKSYDSLPLPETSSNILFLLQRSSPYSSFAFHSWHLSRTSGKSYDLNQRFSYLGHIYPFLHFW